MQEVYLPACGGLVTAAVAHVNRCLSHAAPNQAGICAFVSHLPDNTSQAQLEAAVRHVCEDPR
jgi:hypothetical protein